MPESTKANDGIADLTARLRRERDSVVAERDDLRRELVALHRERWVTRLAQRFDFNDPADAWLYIKNSELSDEDWGSEATVLNALRRVVRDKPHLTRSRRSSRARMDSGALTFDDVRRMSSAEINARWDEVQAALASQA